MRQIARRTLLPTVFAGVLGLVSATDAWAQATGPISARQTYAIRAGLVIDPGDGTARSDQVILVEDGVITAVGSDVSIPPGMPLIDLSGRAVLPGMMDAHVHLTLRVPQGSAVDGWVTSTPMARRTLPTGWSPPAGTGGPSPPLFDVAEVYRAASLVKDQGTWDQVLRRRVRVVFGVRLALRYGDVARLFGKVGKLGVGHQMLVHPEPIHGYPVDGTLFRIEVF